MRQQGPYEGVHPACGVVGERGAGQCLLDRGLVDRAGGRVDQQVVEGREAREVADFGIKVTVVEPAGFATRSGKNPDPLANGHMAEADPIYDPLRRRIAETMGKLPAGDPAAAARALLKIVDSDDPPLRVLFGQGFHQMLQQVYADRLKTWDDWQDLSAEAHGKLEQES